jgi:hypothetical protein
LKALSGILNKYKFLFAFGIQIVVFWWLTKSLNLLYIGGFIFLFGFILPIVNRAISYFEDKLGKALGWSVNTIILSVVYIFFFIPIGIMKKISRKETTTDTLILKDHLFTKIDLENPW